MQAGTPRLAAARPTGTKRQKEHSRPLTNEGINNMRSSHILDYYAAMKRSEWTLERYR